MMSRGGPGDRQDGPPVHTEQARAYTSDGPSRSRPPEPSLARSTAVMATGTLLSRITGLLRVTVVLRLTSPKVDLPAASDPFVLEPGRRTTQLLPVGTRTTGSFPIRVDVLTPDGREVIAAGEIRLVSTAFNRVALGLTGGAVGALLLWWWRSDRRRRAGVDR